MSLHKIKSKSIQQMSLMAFILAALFTFSFACLIVVNEYFEFEKEKEKIETTYIQTQKEEASKQMQLLLNIISYRDKHAQTMPKAAIYERIQEDIRALVPEDKEFTFFIQEQSGAMLYRSNDNPAHSSVADLNALSTTQEYAPLGLVVGVTINMNQMENILAQKKHAYEDKTINFILKIAILTLFLYLVSSIEYRYVSEMMGREIRYIVESFKKISHQYEAIDEKKIHFKELREIALHANRMNETIHDKNRALIELNARLEELIKEKTHELQVSVILTQELLEKQDKFIKNAIHEINTPLSIILMNIDLHNLKFEKNIYLLKIEAAIKVLDNIYEDLAYIVKKDRLVYTKEVVNFSYFLKERIDYFEDVAKANKLFIVREIMDEALIVFSQVLLQRICDNNISNAIKYSYVDNAVYVRLYEKEAYIVLEIENSGETIVSPEKLFDRYYREDVVRGGFGLGLNIVKEICEENDVRIEVISSEHKTLFRYYFLKA